MKGMLSSLSDEDIKRTGGLLDAMGLSQRKYYKFFA